METHDGSTTDYADPLLHVIQGLARDYSNQHGHTYKPELGTYRASSVPYCNRKIALGMLLNDEQLADFPEDDYLFGASTVGQLIHDYLEQALKPILISSEQEINLSLNGFTITGHYDLLLKDPVHDKIVVDVKTTSALPKQPKDSHKKQLLLYQAALGKIPGALLYVTRDSFDMRLFRQDFDPEHFSMLVVKIASLHKDLTEHRLPKRQPAYGYNYECRNSYGTCRFFEYCYGGKELPPSLRNKIKDHLKSHT